MADTEDKDWVLPAKIPFDDMKASDLEETVYWLLDAMGAKDLEWRTGGTGGGAADGGRDLEATFYASSADGELDPQSWWVECKGRSGTVEPDAVKSAINNVQGHGDIDVIVICTNTQFSNPTRDWVKSWQATHARPKVKLWDRSHLERFLSRHPSVVLRLYAEALSLDGRLKAMENKFWNNLEFVSVSTLKALWKARAEVEFTHARMFAVIINEFENGNIALRPWGAIISDDEVVPVLAVGLNNLVYLVLRAHKAGIEQEPIYQTFAYLIQLALENLDPASVDKLLRLFFTNKAGEAVPDSMKEYLLMPIIDELQSQLEDVCSHDCERMMVFRRRALSEGTDEIEDYWLRFEPEGGSEDPEDDRHVRLEKHDGKCVVGFAVDKDHSCPLFELEPKLDSIEQLLAVAKKVMAYRLPEDRAKREAKAKAKAEAEAKAKKG